MGNLWVTDKYATHQPLLVWAVHNTVGSVLELGMGAYSTPLLHMLCENRPLVSIDTNPDYFDTFKPLANGWHTLIQATTWEDLPVYDQLWDVIFVDHAPAEARRPVLERIRGIARYVIVHDTELQAYYGYDKVFPSYSYRVDCKWQPTCLETDCCD